MAREWLDAPSRSVGFALATYPPALFGEAGVHRREGVPSAAMGLGLLFGTTRTPPKGKAVEVVSWLWRDDLGHRKTFRRTAHDRLVLPAARQDEFADEVACAVDDNPLRVSPVALALRFGNPSAILGSVVPINVDAIDHKAIGARPHVCDKGTEIRTPSVTYADAATSVVPELLHPRVAASLLHGDPNRVEGVRVLKRHSCSPSMEHTSTKRNGEPE